MEEKVSSHTRAIFDELSRAGVEEYILCPGNRNVPLLEEMETRGLFYTTWFDERSAGFFALGRSRRTKRPVAVVVTSGTAVAELYPAVMEAYYMCTPLVLLTADRPRRFRKTGAPQSVVQPGIFGMHTPLSLDLAEGDPFSLKEWDERSPLHINACFEEAVLVRCRGERKNPLVVLGELEEKEAIIPFLKKLGAPVYAEGHSQLRGALGDLEIHHAYDLEERAKSCGYPIDAVLRIGGVPTLRFWRDIEGMEVLSLSDRPFSGLPGGELIEQLPDWKVEGSPREWLEMDRAITEDVERLYLEEPEAEQSWVRRLSEMIGEESHVYLGNSLPIRHWDTHAVRGKKRQHITANRGVNGIDGQISSFFGLCEQGRKNWAILGDYTTLYDCNGLLGAHVTECDFHIVVINNSGGRIFEEVKSKEQMVNARHLSFEPLAKMWGLSYSCWKGKTEDHAQLVEVIPDLNATRRFREKYRKLCSTVCTVF